MSILCKSRLKSLALDVFMLCREGFRWLFCSSKVKVKIYCLGKGYAQIFVF
jgi:hypothetical protein